MSFTLLRRSLFLSLALSGPTGIAANAATAAEPVETLLERQTQELLDAVAPGRVEVWQRLLHPDAIYVSENGEVIRKRELLEQITPKPAGMSGSLTVGHDARRRRPGERFCRSPRRSRHRLDARSLERILGVPAQQLVRRVLA
jgi:hypothetical protein